MQATAARSDRVQKPVYDVALFFDPEDTVDQAMMLRVVERLRSDLGAQEFLAPPWSTAMLAMRICNDHQPQVIMARR